MLDSPTVSAGLGGQVEHGFLIRGEDQNIIHVDKNKAIKHVSRNIVHQGLKVLVVATKGLKS